MEILIEEECAACILYVDSIWCVGYASDRLNSGSGVIVALHVLHAALAFIVDFYCCPWSCQDAFLREGRSCGFYRWVSEHSVCWLKRGPLCLDLPHEWRKKNRNEVQRFNQTLL